MFYGLSIPIVLAWVALTLVVLGLFIYRYSLSRNEDDTVHLADSEASMIGDQSALAARISAVDWWRTRLTAIDIAVGLALVGVFSYNALRTSGII